MRRTLAAGLALTLPLLAQGDPAPDRDLAEAARTFLATLSEAERSQATWGFDSNERSDVHYAPIGLDGARHGELSLASQAVAEALLDATLSPEGRARIRAVRELERDVLLLEEPRFWSFASSWMRDPGRYFWAFFGEPDDEAAWAYRLEGHHLSLNVTATPGGAAATTPLFLGAQPRIAPDGYPSAGVAILGEEERLARELYASLRPEQREAATLAYEDDRGHMLGQVGRIAATEPVGIARSALDPGQRALLDALLDRFAALFEPAIAEARRAEIAGAAAGLRFAHVESDSPAHAFYTRVTGPGQLLEIDNTTDGDHLHAVWHRPGADFADDLLARHYEREHGLALAR